MTTLRLRFALVPLFFALLAAAAFLGTQKEGEDLLIQRRYAEAAKSLQQALTEQKPEGKDRILLLLANAQWLGGDRDAAQKTLSRFEEEQPSSMLLPQARYLRAKVEEGSGNLRAAAEIHRGEAERLTGFLRKEDVAKVYLELADKAEKKEPKEFARIVQFCDLALDLGLRPEAANAVRLRAASAQSAAGNAADAVRRLEPLASELTVDAGKRSAMLLLGQSLRQSGDNQKARRVLRDLLALGKDAPEAGDAAYAIALTFGVPDNAAQQVDRAVQALRELRAGWPQHEQSRVVEFLVARCYASAGRADDALRSLGDFLRQDGVSALPEAALARALSGDVLLSQGKIEQALAAWREYLAQHPAHADWERVQRAIVDAEWRLAMQQMAEGPARFADATERMIAFQRAYPLDERNPEAMCAIASMLQQEGKLTDAKAAYERCVSKHPGKEWSSRAQFAIGQLLESKLFDFDGALAAYRAVTFGSMQNNAKARIATLTQKNLHARTERTFRTDEKASFRLTSRNIESVRVRVYKLQLEDWFRATRQAGSVHELDIEVIAADRTFDSAIDGYVRMRETEREIEIPADEPGAYVVKVDDKELESTTLVVKSDLAVITKTSRLEFLVFAQNTKEQRAESGVRVLLADPEGVVAEGATDDKGFWRFAGQELKNRDDLRVFAVAQGGSAATTLDLSGMGYSPGLLPRAHLATDRPIYEPGQRVSVKGVVREVEGGRYRTPKQGGHIAQVFAPSGRLVLQREVQFSEFGTFDFGFDLDDRAELGDWRVQTLRADGASAVHTMEFRVGRYERPRLQLAFDLKESVVLRGESIAGVLRATWFYGEPFAMREVVCTMALPDGGVVERRGQTNAAGELTLELPTAEFQETAVAVLEASAPGENARGVVTVPIVTTELAMSVRVKRPVYLAGETLEAVAEIKDHSGKPLVREAELVYYRLQSDARSGALQEVEVARKAIQSDKDGQARVTFVAHDGGEARVRIVCKDRFGNVVTNDAQFTVSGKDDEQKLRLLADRETWSVGEEAVARVVNRAGKRLALLTWQADGILACESRMIDDGESSLALPMLPEHAPNFALSIAMVDGKNLHVAERPFFVRRELRVEVEAPKSAKPRDTKEVVVRVRDASGKPVRAEIALAMVDESLLALHGDDSDDIGATFWGQRRETSFRTTSSCLWGYEGLSRRVNAALLSEEARMRAAQEPMQDSAGALIVERQMQEIEQLERAALSNGADKQSAFDSIQWNSAVGLGGGAGGTTGSRRRFFAGRPGAAGPVTGGAVALPTLTQGGISPAGFDLFAIGGQDFHLANDLYVGRKLQRVFAQEGPAVRRDFRETGAWIPSLVTDDEGVARAQIAMPDSTTSWRILARGVTSDTWVGEGKASLRTQQDLQVEVVGPSVLTEGDEVRYAVRAHNLGGKAVDGEVRFEQKTGDDVRSEVAAMQLSKGEETQREFAFSALTPGLSTVTARGVFGDISDAAEREALVQPFGVERIAAWSGSSRDRAARELSLPIGGEYAWLRMTVELGGDPGRDLLSAALGQGFLLRNCVQSAPTNMSAASRGIAALVALDWLEATNGALPGDRDRLLAQATASLQTLCAMQQDGGAFGWTGKRSIDSRTTSQALRFLSMAARRGMPAAIHPQNSAAEALLAALRGADNDARADALWALASADRVRFEAMNSLHRARTSLQSDGLARLALAWQAASRPELASEALTTLRPLLAEAQLSELGSETIALAARALLAADLRDAVGMRALNAVRERRVGAGWETMEATAAAVALLAKAQSTGAGEPRATEVTVFVNGRELATKPRSAQALSGAFVVPSEWLKSQGNTVQVQVAGGGEAFWSVTLAGFEKGFRDADRGEELAMVQRSYVATPMRQDGKEVPAGFRCVQGKQLPTFAKEVTQLGVGQSLRVETTFAIRQSMPRMRASPIVVEEPLPAGCSVPRESITGSFEHVEMAGDRIVLYFPEGSDSGNVSYELQARHEGSFRALPTLVYAALRPELRAMGRTSSLRIHPRGQGARDQHRLTPDELLWLGKHEYDAAQALTGAAREEAVARAQGHLASLMLDWNKTDWRLRDDVAADCARMMLFLGIERGDGKQVVRFFEELKDRQPDLVIPFDKILGVGRAYFDLGEFESALLVFRGTEEASFLKDAAVATTLGELGEHKASTRFLEQLLLAYPDLPTMRTARYSIGQQLAAMAAERDPLAAVDDRVGSATELRRRAIAQLREFLVLQPEDPLAEEVAFAWATTLLESKDLEGALAVAQAALRSYADSPFEDEQLYTVGYTQFALGRHDEAFAALQKVAQGTFVARGGGRAESESKWHAIYLQGQIWHARGEPEKALLAYDQVKDRFTDAVEASDYFRQKTLSLDEVSTFATGAPVEIAISYRNLVRAQLQVFKVDLVRLYLVQKSLEDIRGIKLHGIAPMQSLEVELGDGRDYATKVKKVALAMSEPGAYLCVVRSGDRIATGMALVSDLRIEAQEQFAQGRIRVNVRRGDGYVVGAHVKVVGSNDGVVRSGDTDLRGVFVADGMLGRATALAAFGDHYAIYRGDAAHGVGVVTQSAGLPGQQLQQDGGRLFDALDNNFKANVGNRGSQVEWLKKEVMNKKQMGVEVFRTK